MTVTIRPAAPDDVEAVCAVHERARNAYYGSAGPGAGEWRAVFAASVAAPDRALLVAVDGAAVIGLALTAPAGYGDLDPTDVGQLYQLDVEPDRWSAGIGSGLLAAAVDGLHRRGCAEACLEVWQGNARARAFYERYGWRPDGSVRSAGDGLDFLRYRVDLRHRPRR